MRIALQMDPLESINIAGDSTFLLALGAQARGHTLHHYAPTDLSWQQGRLIATQARAVTFRREAGNHFTAAPPAPLDLAQDVDLILLRQDPPFDMGYITSTYLLETLAGKTRVVNDPKGVRDAPEKLLITRFPDLIPPTLVSSDPAQITEFADTHKNIVAKRLHGNAGKDVFLFKNEPEKLLAFAAQEKAARREPVMLQAFLPEVTEGDKRIILFNGEFVGAILRVPAANDFRANLAQGGRAATTELTTREREICQKVGPLCRELGLYFVGLDTISEQLIEINVTSPTGLQSINNLYELQGDARMEMRFWSGLNY